MPRARRIRPAALGAALAAAAAVAGALVSCAGPPVPAAAPDGLSVGIQQGRLDVVQGRLVVRFENTGDEAVTIESFEVVTPTLEPGLERSTPVELVAGDAIAVRLDLPASVCDAEEGPVEVRFTTTRGDGTARLTADDPFDTVARVNAADCLGESVAQVAAITMPDHLSSIGSGVERRAVIEIMVDPAASGTAASGTAASMRIDRIFGTTLLGAEDGTDWTIGIDIAAGDAASIITLPVRPSRCDAHAIADDKRGTILPFEVMTSDGRAGRLDVPAGETLKSELYAYYGERCALGSTSG